MGVGDGPAAGVRGAAPVGAGRAAAAGGAPALGAGDPALAAHALQPAAAAGHVPRPVPRLHTAPQHARVREGCSQSDRKGKGSYSNVFLFILHFTLYGFTSTKCVFTKCSIYIYTKITKRKDL